MNTPFIGKTPPISVRIFAARSGDARGDHACWKISDGWNVFRASSMPPDLDVCF
jgi:hypothetical protein